MCSSLYARVLDRIGNNVWQVLIYDSTLQRWCLPSQINTHVPNIASHIHKEYGVIMSALARQNLDEIGIGPLACSSVLWQPLHKIVEVLRLIQIPVEDALRRILTLLERAVVAIVNAPEIRSPHKARDCTVRRTTIVESIF